jgi:putative SOS response-associated peptidase YedK
MCGRYTLAAPSDLVEDLFSIDGPNELSARFNIAPTQEAPVVLVEPEHSPSRRLEQFRWGLVPFWAKDRSLGDRMINARSETVAEKPAYRASFKKRRCLVVADGFYEWQATGGPKQPYFFRLKSGQPFAMAGLWDRWDKASDENPLQTYTILTTGPNEVVAPVHHRMPVILQPSEYESWLDPQNQDGTELKELLVSSPAEQMEALPVSTYVNNPANEGPRCIEPISLNSP